MVPFLGSGPQSCQSFGRTPWSNSWNLRVCDTCLKLLARYFFRRGLSDSVRLSRAYLVHVQHTHIWSVPRHIHIWWTWHPSVYKSARFIWYVILETLVSYILQTLRGRCVYIGPGLPAYNFRIYINSTLQMSFRISRTWLSDMNTGHVVNEVREIGALRFTFTEPGPFDPQRIAFLTWALKSSRVSQTWSVWRDMNSVRVERRYFSLPCPTSGDSRVYMHSESVSQ